MQICCPLCRRIVWWSGADPHALALSFLDMSLHAMVNAEPGDVCGSRIFIQCCVSEDVAWESGSEASSRRGLESGSEEEENDALFLCSSDGALLNRVYDSLCRGAALNPDPEDSSDDEGFVYAGPNGEGEGEPGDGRFEDASDGTYGVGAHDWCADWRVGVHKVRLWLARACAVTTKLQTPVLLLNKQCREFG